MKSNEKQKKRQHLVKIIHCMLSCVSLSKGAVTDSLQAHAFKEIYQREGRLAGDIWLVSTVNQSFENDEYS